MNSVTLGNTGITVNKNGFGALPIQRVSLDEAVKILHRAYEGGIRYFDTARAYTDSEEKLGAAFCNMRDKIYIATKTTATTVEGFWKDLETSLKTLKTDYIDVYQFHMAKKCYSPDDGTGLYEAMLEAKQKGLIRHIGITAHLMNIAEEIIESGLYETLQFPFNYLSADREIEIVNKCKEKNIGFISMKALSGGLINDSKAAFAFQNIYENALPIWGIQKIEELEEFLSFNDNPPAMTDDIKAIIKKDKEELSGEYCRGCSYCMPCPQGITIFNCARTSLMLRRAPSKYWLSKEWQNEMKKIESCLDCGQCKSKCPYELDTPNLLRKNYEDYKKILSGEIKVN